MLKLSFTYLLQKNKGKIKPEKAKKKKNFESSQKNKKRPVELVINLSLHGHEQRLIVVRLRAIVLDVLIKISA